MITFPDPPPGGYSVIVVDPPWPVHRKHNHESYIGVYGNAPIEGRYNLMPLEEINALPVLELAAERSFVFVWTTQRFLPAALECLTAWGFQYRFTMVWHKPAGPQPIGYPCFNTEFIVVGNRGNNLDQARTPGFLDTREFATGFTADRGKHSAKPAYFYELLARVTPGPRIDLFARRRHPGFEAWGDEVEDFMQSNLGIG